ncbi:MAG: hypothetical protein ACXW1B_03105 [Nitrososphaeraceae archaeon]
MNIEQLKSKFPQVTFTKVTEVREHKNESSFSLSGKDALPNIYHGKFIRMVNVKGGADTVPASDTNALVRLATFHQEVAER